MVPRKGIRGILTVLLALALLPASAAAAPFVNGEFQVSGLGEGNKLVAGPDGNIWVTVTNATKDVARIAPKTGAVEEFDLPNVKEPLGIASAGGFLWVTQEGGVAKFAPATPTTTTTTPIAAIKNSHSIVAGPDGNLWVATDGALLRIPPANPAGFTEFKVAGLSPRDIDVAGQILVVGDFANHRFLTATTDGTVTEHAVHAVVRGVAGSPSGQIAFSQAAAAPELGLFAPPGPPVFMPAPGIDPIGVALGPDGAFWAAEAFGTESVTRFGPASGAPMAVVPGFAKNSRPRQIAAGPENTLWVTLPGAGGGPAKVGRVSGVEKPPVPPPPPPSEPQTKLGKGPKGTVKARGKLAKVKFTFSSTTAGAGFECRLVRQAPKKQAKSSKAARFAACKSPKTYGLKPGRYRFEVRAVLAGIADKTPAASSFRVLRPRNFNPRPGSLNSSDV